MSDGKSSPSGTLSKADVLESTHILPDKSDMFLAYATVPGYKAHAGGKDGSIYLQTFAKYLLQEYKERPLDKIVKMVRQHMVKTVQDDDGMKQCPEERTSLIYDVRFSEFSGKGSERKEQEAAIRYEKETQNMNAEETKQHKIETAKMEHQLKETRKQIQSVEKHGAAEEEDKKEQTNSVQPCHDGGAVQSVKSMVKAFDKTGKPDVLSETASKVTGQKIKQPPTDLSVASSTTQSSSGEKTNKACRVIFSSTADNDDEAQETVTNDEGVMEKKTEIPEPPKEERAKMEDESKKTTEKSKRVEKLKIGEKAEMKKLSTGRVQVTGQEIKQPRTGLSVASSTTQSSSGEKNSKACLVIFSSTADNDDELTMEEGDIITNVQEGSEPGWWEGEINGQRGMFPENFVEVIKVQETVTNNEGEIEKKIEIPEQPKEGRAKMEDELKKTTEKLKRVEKLSKGEKAEMKRLGTGRVQYLIKTISKSLKENEQPSRPGEPSAKVTGQSIKRPLIRSVFPPPPPPPIATVSGNSHNSTMPLSCRALYDYQAQAVDEITLRKDDVITNVAKPKGNPWWTGEINGQRGFFPANYVEEIKNSKAVAMKLLSIHDTSLPFWHATGMSPSPSGDAVILFCKMSEDEPPSFVFFDLETLEKRRVIKALCEHERGVNMLPVTVDNTKLLAVLCADCQIIRLINLETSRVSIAVQDKELRPGAPCLGNANQMFCLHMVVGFPVIGIDWSTTEFKVDKIFETGLGSISGITYVPSENILAISDAKGGFIQALRPNTGTKVWEVNKLPDSSPFTPYSLEFSVNHNVIIVCAKNKILLLNPHDGSIVQVVVPQQSMGFAGDVCVFDDVAVILHKSPDGKWKFSKYSLQ